MNDAHYHRGGYATFLSLGGREYRFHGVHPWAAGEWCAERELSLRRALAADVHAGVGEIGLDRLRKKEIGPGERIAFEVQLRLAAEFRRPVVLHGAKCWGEVAAACRPFAGRIPAFLFHGFSRSGGLLSAIYALNGFVGVGASLLNDHATNYRTLVKEVASDRLLVETDANYFDEGRSDSTLDGILRKLSELRGEEPGRLAAAIDANLARFAEALA